MGAKSSAARGPGQAVRVSQNRTGQALPVPLIVKQNRRRRQLLLFFEFLFLARPGDHFDLWAFLKE
jgi:hypothetical protein